MKLRWSDRGKKKNLHFQTSPVRRAQRRCTPGCSGVACFQSLHRSCHLPGWTLWAGLWSTPRYTLWVRCASGSEGLCSFGLSPSAAMVKEADGSEGGEARSTWKHVHTHSICLSLSDCRAEKRWLQKKKRKKKNTQNFRGKINYLLPSVLGGVQKIVRLKDCVDFLHLKQLRIIWQLQTVWKKLN